MQKFQKADKIEDVKPQEHSPWVSNVVIKEKKQSGLIRINIDMRQAIMLCAAPSDMETPTEKSDTNS